MRFLKKTKTTTEEVKTVQNPDGTTEKIKTETQGSLVSSLKKGAAAPKKKGLKDNPLLLIGIIAGILLLLGIIVAVLAMSGKKQPTKVERNVKTETIENQVTSSTAVTSAVAVTPVPVAAPVNPNDFTVSATPIETLANQSVDAALPNTPQYKLGNGSTVVYPTGQTLSLTDPLVMNAKQNSSKRIVDYLTTNGIIQQRSINGVGANNGQQAWYIRMPKDPARPNDPEFVPINDVRASQLLREGMTGQASTFLTEELDKAIQGQPAVQAPASAPAQVQIQNEPIMPKSVITEEQKQGYLTLISKQRADNLDLVRQNKELKEKMQAQKQQTVAILQQIEDNRYASNKLQASMLPKSTGYKVVSVLGDKVWLEDKDGELISLSQGDKIPNTELQINGVNAGTGVVLVTPAKK